MRPFIITTIFSKLYPHFYYDDGSKHIPLSLLPYCTMPHFLSVLYMDDGSLCISSHMNKRKKIIYFNTSYLSLLALLSSQRITNITTTYFYPFGITFRLSKRPDGQGMILKTTSVKDTFLFFESIASVIHSCPSMYYKTSWKEQLKSEEAKWKNKLPDFTILVISSERMRPYSDEEIQRLKELKQQGATINEIAKTLERSYWSIVYKWKEVKGE
jgi:hypothetical protein